jgi:aconitate hydratase
MLRAANKARQYKLDRPASYAEKIIRGHLAMPIDPHTEYIKLTPDRVAMQDASAQTAILQFASANIAKTRIPASIHCDHYVAASNKGHKLDLEHALEENKQVFQFLKSAAKAYGIDFWKPGAGIIHQTVLENVRLFKMR